MGSEMCIRDRFGPGGTALRAEAYRKRAQELLELKGRSGSEYNANFLQTLIPSGPALTRENLVAILAASAELDSDGILQFQSAMLDWFSVDLSELANIDLSAYRTASAQDVIDGGLSANIASVLRALMGHQDSGNPHSDSASDEDVTSAVSQHRANVPHVPHPHAPQTHQHTAAQVPALAGKQDTLPALTEGQVWVGDSSGDPAVLSLIHI